jgi:hypothetical protein
MKGNGPTHPDSESAPDAFETLIYDEHKGVRFEVQLLAVIEGGRRKAVFVRILSWRADRSASRSGAGGGRTHIPALRRWTYRVELRLDH